MTDNKWLEKAEYASLLASVAGAVASQASQQIIFASAPLSLALFLNIINRRRADEMTQLQVDTDIVRLRQNLHQVDQKVWQDVDSLRQQFLALPTAPEQFDFTQVKEELASVRSEMHHRLTSLETLDLAPVHEEVSQLQGEVTQLQINLQDAVNQTIPELTELQDQVSFLSERIEQPISVFDSTSLEQRFEELKATIVRLEQKTENPPPERDPSFLISEIKTMSVRQDTLEQELIKAVQIEMQTHLSQFAQVGFNSINAGISQLQTEMAQLHTNLQIVANQPPVDLTPLQEQIDHINYQFGNIPLAFDASHLEQSIEDLKMVITRLEDEAENSPLKQDLTVFFSAMRNLYQHQNGVKEFTTLHES